jgi:hypothetical protein
MTAIDLQDHLERLDEIIRRAKATGNTEAHTKAINLLAQLLRQAADDDAQAAFGEPSPDPMMRARTRESQPAASAVRPGADDREADGLHKLREGRERCSATRRDGEPCQAPAVEGHYVCRRHGGGAPQVQIVAKHHQLLMARHTAEREFEAARGTPGEFDALCRWSAADREVDAYEVKLRLLAELRAAAKRRRAPEAER